MTDISQHLSLTSEQFAEIQEELRKSKPKIVYRNGLRELIEGKWIIPDWAERILLPHQLTWLQQFEYQLSTMPDIDSFGLLDGLVKSHLKLTEEQVKEIKELVKNYRTAVATINQEHQTQVNENLRKTKEAYLALLTPFQVDSLRSWYGSEGW